MAETAEVLQQQLLIRAYNSPYVSTEIVAKGVNSLFTEAMYQTIALQLVKYYEVNTEPITKNTLKVKLEEQFNIQRKTTGGLSPEEEVRYYNAVNDIDTAEIDDSVTFVQELNGYVRDALSKTAIIEEVGKGEHQKEYDINTNLRERLDDIDSLSIEGQAGDSFSAYRDLDYKAQLYEKFDKDKLPCGLKGLDDATEGGLAKGELAMIGASTGDGKTTTLSNLAVSYTRQGYNVLYVLLEELANVSNFRIDRILMEKPSDYFLLNGTRLVADYKQKMKVFLDTYRQNGKLGELEMVTRSPHTMTIAQLQQVLLSKQRQLKLKFDVVIVDYPDIMANPLETGNESKDGGRLYEDLRKLAQDNDVLMWTATQLNRTAKGEDIKSLYSVEGSFRKANTCEFVCILNITQAERDKGFMRLHIDKNRNAHQFRGDNIYFKYNYSTLVLRDETELEHAEHLSLIDEGRAEDKEARKAYYGQQASQQQAQKAQRAQELNQNLNSMFSSYQ